ncbi:MAG TPA: hypothetical protein VN666_14470 [Nitrospira sp.]|nr:hypothetical protein [Nitrospira sp.]
MILDPDVLLNANCVIRCYFWQKLMAVTAEVQEMDDTERRQTPSK